MGEPESAARPESDPELTPRRGGPPAGRTATKSGDPGTTRTRTEPPPAEPQPESDPPPAAAAVAEPKAERTASPAPETAPAPEPEPDRAPPEPTATQEIAFSSKPLGVAVSVDGVYRGTTPLRVTLTEGPHKVAYDGPDGTRYKTVQVVAGERQVVIYDQAKDVIR